jgi:MoxR-like ATPase
VGLPEATVAVPARTAAGPFGRAAVEALSGQVVGRRREVELVVAALGAGAHVLLEGPPGTGKSTLLRDLARAARVPYVPVEGNAELTPSRLVGHFDPALVLTRGYLPDVFVDGPLLEALRDGALLYVEEVNRVPEETLNVLITVMSEGEVHVPRLGTVQAAPGFRLVAAMNPFDAVGTARISSAVYDRVSRVHLGYQDEADETEIVLRQAPGADRAWVEGVVQVVRSTRTHSDVRVGSSVRGALELVKVATTLAELRGTAPQHTGTGLDAALVALSGRVRLQESCPRTAEEVVRELWQVVFGAAPEEEADPGGA